MGFVIEGGVVKLYSTLMAENLCTILCCLHTFHKEKKKRWSRQSTVGHLEYKKSEKIFGHCSDSAKANFDDFSN